MSNQPEPTEPTADAAADRRESIDPAAGTRIYLDRCIEYIRHQVAENEKDMAWAMKNNVDTRCIVNLRAWMDRTAAKLDLADRQLRETGTVPPNFAGLLVGISDPVNDALPKVIKLPRSYELRTFVPPDPESRKAWVAAGLVERSRQELEQIATSDFPEVRSLALTEIAKRDLTLNN